MNRSWWSKAVRTTWLPPTISQLVSKVTAGEGRLHFSGKLALHDGWHLPSRQDGKLVIRITKHDGFDLQALMENGLNLSAYLGRPRR